MFTSDRGGNTQFYAVSATGGDPARLTFNGDYNARATISWDGKKVAMAQGSGNVYRIAVMDRSFGGLGRWQNLSPGNLAESPSFAHHASILIYAAREGKRGVLYAVSADERVRQRLHPHPWVRRRSEEHTYELQSLMSKSYAVFCLKQNN